jgi:Ran GTPase-activating protein (RanGAP) involved in mRNA processing and transport
MGSLDFSAMGSAMSAQDEEDAATDFSYRTQSPRAIFINGCLKNKIPPITIALVRRNLTSTINLAHMGIGDKIAGILAGCLSSLPYLQVLNLADNNLADKGLSELLNSASKHKEIEELDISNNTVGTAASKALGAFLANPDCKLRSLRLRDANIDDAECANICGVLKKNTNLKELDLSKNLLGKRCVHDFVECDLQLYVRIELGQANSAAFFYIIVIHDHCILLCFPQGRTRT